MANIVEFLVKVKDLASGPLGKISGTGGKAFSQLEQSLNKTKAGFSRLDTSISQTDQKLNQLRKSREISLDSSQIRKADRDISNLERRKAKLEGNSSGGGFGLGGLVGGAMAMAGIAGLGGLVSAGMEKSMTNTSFEVMAGKQQGGDLSKNLLQFAQDTIYGKEVLGIGQTMLGFGLKAEAVMPSVQKLGDIAMGNAEKFKSLGLVYSQVAAQGKLMGSDALQFINAGFNPLQVISDKTGKSMGVLKKEMEEGKITFAMVADAIDTATGKGGRFYNMTNNLAESAPGKLLGLQGAFENMLASVGVGIVEAMVPLIDLTQWMLDTPAALAGLTAGLAALTVGIGVYKVVTGWAAISQWLLNIAMMWPVILIAVLVGAIAALIYRYKGWGDAMQALWKVIKAWCSNVGIVFKDTFQEIGYHIQWLVLKAKSGFQWIGEAVGNMMRALKLASEFKFAEAKQALTAEIKTKASAEIEELERTRGDQRKKNLMDFAANISTIRNTGVMDKLKLRTGGSKSASDIAGRLTDFAAAGAGAPASADATNKGIHGGGVRHLTISVGKYFDDLHIHSATVNEAVSELEEKLLDMFMRVTNSGNAIIRD